MRWVPGRGSSSSGPPLAYSDTLAQPGLALPAATTTTTTTTPRPHTATSSSDEGSPGVLESCLESGGDLGIAGEKSCTQLQQ